MKRRFYIGILFVVLVIMSACHTPTHEARQMVRRAERLGDTLPDSTERLIDSVLRMPVYFNERQRMDMALLQAEVLFRDTELDDNYDFLDSTTTSPELEHAPAYYARKKQYDKAARAALYIGYVQQHYDEKEAAMSSYKEAERYGEFAEDSLSMARAEYRMGKMLIINGMEKDAKSILQAANRGLGNRYTDKALTQNLLATCYILLDDYEKAKSHLQLSLEYADKGNSTTAKTKALNNYAVLYRQKGEYNKAINYLNQAEAIIDTENKIILYLNLAKIYMAQGKTDSASLYFQHVKNGLATNNVKSETKASAYGTLSQFAESQGNYADAYQYRGLYDHLLFNLMAEREQKNIYRIRQQYDYNILKETMNKKVIHRQRIIMFLSILVALVLIAFSISQIRLAKTRKQETDLKANLLNFIQQNRELAQKSAEQEKNNNVLLAEYKNAYEDCANKLSDAWLREQRTMQKLVVYLNNDKDAALLGSLRQTVFGNYNYWDAMMKSFDKRFPGLRKRIIQQYHLTDNELKILLLSYIDTSRDDTALLLNLSIHMVDKLRTSVKKKMQKMD